MLHEVHFFNKSYSANFDTMKTKIVTTIESAQKLVKEPEFIDHVQTDCQKMCTIDDDLKKHLEDMERDNAIIIAGIAYLYYYIRIKDSNFGA